MSDPNRILPPFVRLPTHTQGEKPCMVCTDMSVSTVTSGNGHYVALVINQPESPVGAVAIFSKEQAEAHIALLQYAIADVDRLYAGKPALSTLAVGTRQ